MIIERRLRRGEGVKRVQPRFHGALPYSLSPGRKREDLENEVEVSRAWEEGNKCAGDIGRSRSNFSLSPFFPPFSAEVASGMGVSFSAFKERWR